MRIFEATPIAARLPTAWERVSPTWRAGDMALLEMLVARQLDALLLHVPAREWSRLLELLEALHTVQPAAALAIADRLDTLVQRLGVDGLRRWVLTGLRMFEAGDPASLRAFFALENHAAVEALNSECGGAALADALPSLSWLWGMLAGELGAVQAGQQSVLHAAAARPVLDAEHGLFLPDSYTALDAPDHWALWRAALAHGAAHWRHSPRKQSGRGLKPMGHAVVGALEDARVELLLGHEFPGVRRWFLDAFAPPPDAAWRTGFDGLIARLHWALADAAYEDENGWIVKARTVFGELRQSGELAEPGPLRAAASILANDLGQLRLRMNLQAFHVPAPYRDDNSFLWDLGDSEDDPSTAQEVQKDLATPPPQPIQAPPENEQDDADQAVATSEPESSLPFFYPEWDYRLDRVRADWCTLYERQPPVNAAALRRHNDARAPVRAQGKLWRAAVRTQRQIRLRRQWQGEDLDLDAVIDWQVDRRACSDPSPRIFRDAGRASPPLSVLVLVDLSESCNDRLAGTDLCLLDLQKRALRWLAERMDRSTTRLAIHGFHSDTRKSVSYFRMLEFGERLGADSAALIDGLRAGYSTRLGAALRHATRVAESEPGAHRAIVVLSDGVPSDIDVFDERYLASDARVAVQAARSSGVVVAALAVGGVDSAALRAIYGASGYCAVRNPLELPTRLLGLLERLVQ